MASLRLLHVQYVRNLRFASRSGELSGGVVFGAWKVAQQIVYYIAKPKIHMLQISILRQTTKRWR